MAIINRIKKAVDTGKHTTGAKIRQLRLSKNVSAKDIGSACGINDMAVRNYETGQRQPNDERLKKIASFLDVNYAALIDRKIDSYIDVMHILFEIEADYGIIPYALNEVPFVGISSQNPLLNEALQNWLEKYKQWKNKDISDEEYTDWKNSFPARVDLKACDQVLKKQLDLSPIEKEVHFRKSLTEIKYIVVNYSEQIAECIQHKDDAMAAIHLDCLKRTIEKVIDSEIHKL